MKRKLSAFLVICICLSLCCCATGCIYNINDISNRASQTTAQEETLVYQEIHVGETIRTDFVIITIDEVATADAIKSIRNGGGQYNSQNGEEYLYIKGTITNNSSSVYDVGSIGSLAYSSGVSTVIDCDLKMSNGVEETTGTLITDDGGIYGVLSDGIISPQQTITFYYIFAVDKTQRTYYLNGEIYMAFADGFSEEPNYRHSNCEYLFKIKV